MSKTNFEPNPNSDLFGTYKVVSKTGFQFRYNPTDPWITYESGTEVNIRPAYATGTENKKKPKVLEGLYQFALPDRRPVLPVEFLSMMIDGRGYVSGLFSFIGKIEKKRD